MSEQREEDETITHIAELTPDDKNARRHSLRNLGEIADSLRAVGAARSIVVDEDGRILAGNGLIEAAAEVDITRVRVVDADGDEIIAVRRRGLALVHEPSAGRSLAASATHDRTA